jgi:thioredoxin-like negative regulator of GroEL
MEPIVNGLEKKYSPDFKIVRVDVDTRQGKNLAREHGCIGQPAFVLFDGAGNQVRKLMGSQTAATFEQEIERILVQHQSEKEGGE